MTKIRIYELAKELGVDNKVIIDKAHELGMHGKASHSHALDPDEVDKLRRAFLKRNVAGASQKSETITTRVDKVTGAAEAILESRSGNVIRRRRAGTTSDHSPVSAHAATTGMVASTAHSNVSESPIASNTGHRAALHSSEGSVAVAESSDLGEISLAEPAAAIKEEIIIEEASEALAATVNSNGVHHEQEIAVVPDAPIVEEPPAPEIVEELPPEPPSKKAPVVVAPEVPKKPTVGPRVLGKIELVQKKAPKPEARKTFGAQPAVRQPTEEEEAETKRGAPKKRARKREISRVDLIDYEGSEPRRVRSGSKSRKDSDSGKFAQQENTKMKASKRVVHMGEAIVVGELAKQMSLKAGEIISKLMELGMLATINQSIDFDTATIIANEFEYQVESTSFDETQILGATAAEESGERKTRPPVVTVMGHVDHGKTSLLDAVRNASVAAREHGGITQHIGAYRVILGDGRSITFIDTPGHAAFTSMRARGAKVTDIVILVVAADEGVMPQTIEALNHAKAAQVPIVVAVNKIDKPGANLDRIKQQLAEYGLSPEEWGGDTIYAPVSAVTKKGIPELLESLLLVAEVRELKAVYDRRAQGAVIESRQEKGRGSVATVLVQNGSLKVGDIFVAGADFGRVRSMTDHDGKRVDEAGPSHPVEITGFSTAPEAGDDFLVVDSEAQARQVAQNRTELNQLREQRAFGGPISLEEFAKRANNMAALELNVVLKADVHGSVEAVREALEKQSTEKVRVKVLHAAVGGVNESDVQLAITSKAIVVGFGVRAEARAAQVAEASGIEVRFYRIIYELLDDVKKAMAGLLAPIKKEVSLGRAEVRNTFTIPKSGTIAGSFVTQGTIKRSARIRLLRDNRVIFEGGIGSLRRFKDDVREVQSGYECGIGIEGYNDVKVGDVLDVFEYEEIAQEL